jgi:pimeloyl-ACP methyl ester carboxylesterase
MADCDPGAPERLTLRVGALSFTATAHGRGPLVLLIHGFPDGPETFRHQAATLARAGYRAVAVATRGYEAGSRPEDGNYSLARLAEDVLGWIDALGERQAHLVGHDWGANLAFAAARAAPERVLSLTMMAVPHPGRLGALIRSDPGQLRRSSYVFFFQLRPLADVWVGLNRAAFVERMWRKWSPAWRFGDAEIRPARARFSDGAVVTAALSYYRQVLDAKHPDAAESLALFGGVQTVRTLGLTGEEDGCISADIFEAAMRAEDFPGGLTVERIAGAGHFIHREQAEAVNARLLAWLGHRQTGEALS